MGEVNLLPEYKLVEFQAPNGENYKIYIYKEYLEIERNSEFSSKLTLKEGQKTLYNLSTPYGTTEVNITTLELVITMQVLYASYLVNDNEEESRELRVVIED